MVEEVKEKYCGRCKTMQAADNFSKAHVWCRPCKRAYREENRARINANCRAWQIANPDKHRANQHKQYEKNAEKRRADAREYRRLHPTYRKDYKRLHLEREAQWNRESTSRRRAKLREVVVDKVDYAAVLTASNELCGLCGEALDPTLVWPTSLATVYDHIVPIDREGPHTADNLRAAHAKGNARKWNRTDEEYYLYLEELGLSRQEGRTAS